MLAAYPLLIEFSNMFIICGKFARFGIALYHSAVNWATAA